VNPDSLSIRGPIRAMQVVLLALIAGVVSFTAYCLVSGPVQANPQLGRDSLPIISIVAAAMFVTNTVLSFILPGVIAQGALTALAGDSTIDVDSDEDADEMQMRLLQSRQTGLIVAAALLEAAAFTAALAYLLEGQTWPLGIVAGAVLLMLIHFPGEGRLRAWLDSQQERLRGLRQMAQLDRR
jgi:hypothetical protein